jgi:glycosyltransferase involved in cell wall biosynthesis
MASKVAEPAHEVALLNESLSQMSSPDRQDSPVQRTRVVVYTTDVLGRKMAGPAIRALRIAEALSSIADVRLLSEAVPDLVRGDFHVAQAGGASLLEHVEWADVLILQGPLLTHVPEILDTGTVIVADLYDPFLFEELQRGLYLEAADQKSQTDFTVRGVNDMIRYADFMMCASEKQRDMLIGQLASLGRINDLTYRADSSLRNLIDVVPFGIDESAPVQREHGIRGVVPGIDPNDKVILWGGGIYDWFDPLTLIHAVAKLSKSRADVRLFFLATHHPHPEISVMQMAHDARELAESLGVLGTHVFFNESWVAHEDRANYFLDADVGVSTHLEHLETSFSFRTRLLDYIWAGLPIINSSGDAFEPVITELNLGRVVRPGDVDALADALAAVLYDEGNSLELSANVRSLAPSLTWKNALLPLVAFCLNPHRAADAPQIDAERAQARYLTWAQDNHLKMLASREEALLDRLNELESSQFWRITKPFRVVVSRVRRLASGGRGARR